jgi:hypothetical protein
MLPVLLLAWAAPVPVAPPARPSAALTDGVAEWRGRVVCVDETGGQTDCRPQGNLFALQSADGRLHWFAPDDPLAPVFDDVRVRGQDLALKVRPRADGTADLIKVHAVKNGTLHDVRYFCEVCNVTSFVPGLCPCCRAEMELKETPVE